VNRFLRIAFGNLAPVLGVLLDCTVLHAETARDFSTGQLHGSPLWFTFGAGICLMAFSAIWLVSRYHKRYEKALQESETRFRAIAEDQTELVCRHLPDGTLTFVNEAYCRYFARTRDELLGQNLLSLVPRADQADLCSHLASLGPRNPVTCHEHRVLTPEDGIRWQQWTRRALFDYRNRIVEFQGIGRDITELRETREALRSSEETARVLINGTQETLVLLDREGILLTVNQVGAERLGRKQEELIGINIFDSLSDEVALQYRKHFEQVISTGQPVRFEDRCGNLDFVISLFPIFDCQGQVGQVAAFALDCTERKRIERAFQERERTLNSILAAAPVGIGLTRNRIMTWASDNLLKMLGYSPHELVGKSIRILYESEEEYQRAGQTEYRTILEQGNSSVETRWVRRNGRVVDILFSSAPLDPADLSAGVTFTAMDITERKRAVEALNIALAKSREQRDKTEVILRSMADGLIFSDSRNRIVMMSESAENMLGKPLRDVFLRPATETLENRQLVEQLLSVQSGDREESTIELVLPDPRGGKQRIVQARSSAVKNGGNSEGGVITLLRDVSRERDLDRMKSEFISTAAHELRTPLTAVMGFSELLLAREDLDGEEREYLAIIHKKSEVLEKIIDELLDLARIDSGQVIRLHRDWTDVGKIVKRSTGDFQHSCPNHRFTVAVPEKAVALVDDRKLFQVMENLLNNAAKFSPEGSLIEVNCELLGQEILVRVRDEGIGMSPEQVKRVFDKFYRADASNTAKGGLGLGMAIVKNIIQAHQGRVWVDSAPDEGTTVTFTLPIIARS
jgi:PAS domain S-box-containing protein